MLHIVGRTEPTVEVPWWALAVIGAVIVIDASRTLVSLRTAHRYRSVALQSNALHFGSDLAGSVAVLVGLVFVRAGFDDADSAAALFVAVIVVVAAGRLMRRNVDVLDGPRAGRRIRGGTGRDPDIEPPVELRRLRIRQAAGRHFADVVIGVAPDAAVGQGHAAADAVEEAIERALPETDVVVHVEPLDVAGLRERIQVAAASIPQVREIHNISAVRTDDGVAVSLHLKLPGSLPLGQAHEVASEVEKAIEEAAPEVSAVQTHLEPLSEGASGRELSPTDLERDNGLVDRIVREATGQPPRKLRFLYTEDGLVAFLTLALDPEVELAEAHLRASEIEEEIRRAVDVSDVVVHTEP